jgi:hypothetical protein
MWIYREDKPGNFTVGHYEPVTGKFVSELTYIDRELAAARCSYLNGSITHFDYLEQKIAESKLTVS